MIRNVPIFSLIVVKLMTLVIDVMLSTMSVQNVISHQSLVWIVTLIKQYPMSVSIVKLLLVNHTVPSVKYGHLLIFFIVMGVVFVESEMPMIMHIVITAMDVFPQHNLINVSFLNLLIKWNV
jgi:hypothetical protein